MARAPSKAKTAPKKGKAKAKASPRKSAPKTKTSTAKPVARITLPHEATDALGRPTDYKPAYVDIARAMAKLGGTDFEIAEELGVTTMTVWRWRSKYPEFCYALDEGKEAFDNRIERSLAQRASGYSYHSEKVMQYEGKEVRANIVEHMAPDIGAIKLWLSNRRPDVWREKAEVNLTGAEAFTALWQAVSMGGPTTGILWGKPE